MALRLTTAAAKILSEVLPEWVVSDHLLTQDEVAPETAVRLAPLGALLGDTIDGNEAVLARWALAVPAHADKGTRARVVSAFQTLAKGPNQSAALCVALRILQSPAERAQRAERQRLADRIIACDPSRLSAFACPETEALSPADQRLYVATLLANGAIVTPPLDPLWPRLGFTDVELCAAARALPLTDDARAQLTAIAAVMPSDIAQACVRSMSRDFQAITNFSGAADLWRLCTEEQFRTLLQHPDAFAALLGMDPGHLAAAAAVLSVIEPSPNVLIALCRLPVAQALETAQGMRELGKALDPQLAPIADKMLERDIGNAVATLRALQRLKPSEDEAGFLTQQLSSDLSSPNAIALVQQVRPVRDFERLSAAIDPFLQWAGPAFSPERDGAGLRLALRSPTPDVVIEVAKRAGCKPDNCTLEALLATVDRSTPADALVAICAIDWKATRPAFDAYWDNASVENRAMLAPTHAWLELRDLVVEATAPKDAGAHASWSLQRINWPSYHARATSIERELNARPRGYAWMLTDPGLIPLLRDVSSAARPDLGIDATLLLTNAMAEGVALLVQRRNPFEPITVDEDVSGFEFLGTDTFGSRVDALKARKLFPQDENRYTTAAATNELGQSVVSADFQNLAVGLMAMTALLADERRNATHDAKALGVMLSKEQADFFTLLYYNAGSATGGRLMRNYGAALASMPFPGAQPQTNTNARYNALSRLSTLRLLRTLLHW